LWVPQVVVNPGGRAIRTIGYGNGGATQLASIAVVDAPRAEIVDSSLNPSQLSLASIGFGNSFGSSFGGSFGNVVVQDQQPCRLPRAATIDPRSKSLLVACLGIHSVVAFDAASVRPAVTEKRRWRVPAGPTGIAVEPKGRRAVVWSQFDRSVSFIPLDGPELVNEQQELNDAVVSIKMPSEGPQDIAIAMGRLLFHASGDSRISQDGRACASCHPDGRDDSLTWSTPNGPRRTLTLAGRLGGTAPYAWDGTSRDLHHHLGTTFKRLGGTGLTNVERDALVAYLRTLEAPPPLPPSAPSDAIALGERLFRSEEAACASCHEGSLLTDNAKHDVESRAEADAAPSFNTPSLKHVSQRAPYFHDGRYATLQQLLVGSDGTMGHSQHLSPREVAALVAYMESL
jgi:mono/diheme cytochrome c family protein